MKQPFLSVWPPLPPDVYVRRPRTALPFPLDRREHRLYARGRHALWNGVRGLDLPAGSAALVPAYHHGSEVEALSQAGLASRFYGGTDLLEPDADELERLLDPRVRALYLIHYLGFPQDSPRWRRWCDERGLLLIEDVAQGWLARRDGRPLGADADLAIYCLYKTFGLPDGGALFAARVAVAPSGPISFAAGGLVRRHAFWFAGRSGVAATALQILRRESAYVPDEDFSLGDPSSPPDRATLAVLRRIVDETAAARRRANYLVLLEELGHLVPPPFDRLPDEAAPFAFPVAADDKPALLAALRKHGVEGLDFWSTPHPLLPVDEHPEAAKRRATLVAVPVHHELRRDDVDRIAEAVRGPRGQRGALRLERAPSFEDLRTEWTALAEATRNVFATWEWATTWWQAGGYRRPHHLLAARAADGSLVALLPLYEWRSRPLRVVRQLGHDAGDQLGPICAPRDRTRAAAALRLALAELGADVLLAEHLPADEGWSAQLRGRILLRESSPILPLAAAAGDVGSGKLRKSLRYEQRRLEREHSVSYRLAADASRLDDDLDILFALHRARWPSGASAFGPQETFQRSFAHVAFARGWLRLWFLELDGRPAAAWYGFRYCGVESHYQSGRDPTWERSSVGLLLLAHTIDEARADGMDEYRFLRGGEAYKHRFATADPGLETVGLGRGALGNAALAGATAARLIRSRTAEWATPRRTRAPATSSRR